MTDALPARRLLLVHAHPDDEVTGTGATMAHYAATGAHVTLVTCTLGEEGEIHVPELAQLEAAQADQLGGYRLIELDDAVPAELVGLSRLQLSQGGNVDLAFFTERTSDQRHVGSRGGVVRHGGAGADRLVVRVGVDEQDASDCHS